MTQDFYFIIVCIYLLLKYLGKIYSVCIIAVIMGVWNSKKCRDIKDLNRYTRLSYSAADMGAVSIPELELLN